MGNTVDVTPTPEGLKHIAKVLRAQVAQSRELLRQANERFDALTVTGDCTRPLTPLLHEALGALVERENARIAEINAVLPEMGAANA